MSDSHGALGRLSLQHLRVLDALLSTNSVTHAASLLGVTQSAVSHSLRGLRGMLGDELLVRSGSTMLPTTRALAIKPGLRAALNQLESTLSADALFDPGTVQRCFTLAMDDVFAVTFLPQLLDIVRAEAPGVDLDIRPTIIGRRGETVATGDADLELTPGLPDLPSVRCVKAIEVGYASVVRQAHPDVGRELDLDTYCRLPHALISLSGSGQSAVDRALSALGRERRVQLRIRSFAAAPMLVAHSDLILTGPDVLLEQIAEAEQLRLLEPPLELPRVTIYFAWHAAVHNDPAHAWLRAVCSRAMQA